ncbi:gag/pol protein [Cucumis melo var. makuwa]|uniref:Gag/pol protein n=1 Tax=Cucumis melo var. makuwa TaxID=1194695 RepID=A0A5D3BFS9_CUCMM|nr:gag/pol protein [Cucumis melo var. makuwa]
MSSLIIALLKKDQLTGENYATWKSKLNMILVIADLRFVLMEECHPFPIKYASQSVRDAYDRWTKANDKARLHILASMSDILSKKHEIMVTTRQIMDSLREMFGQPSIQIKQEANVAYSRRFSPSSSGSEKIQKRKGGKGKGPTIAAEGNGKAKVTIKGNISTEMLIDIGKETALSKMTKRPFTGKGYRAKEPLELIHSDLCGPMNVKARGGFEYFISFIDDYSRYGYLYLMEHKSEALEKFKEYKTEVENLLTPGTPQQNGVSERTNRTLLDMVHSMMSYAQLPSSFWGGRKPSLSHFKIWGCPAHVLVKNPKKLEPRSRLCQFVSYPKEMRGGLFFDPQENRVFVSTNATFLEEDHMRDHKPRSKLVLNEATDKSTRVVDEVGLSSRVDESITSGLIETQVVIPDDGVEHPLSYKQVMNDVDKDQWVKAMDLEMESMYFNSVWELVDLPEGVKPIGCKWIYKRKRDSAGKVQTFKARLVAKGYTQREGVDYEETFFPVAMLKSIRILLSIATFYDYEIWQMDVKTAFLNGNLEESIFMSQPEGFITQGQEQEVCKLNRSIYRLKQASRSWNIRFDTTIKSYGFNQNVDEPCVYKKMNKGKVAFLVLYVDDILLIGNDVGYLTDVKA